MTIVHNCIILVLYIESFTQINMFVKSLVSFIIGYISILEYNWGLPIISALTISLFYVINSTNIYKVYTHNIYLFGSYRISIVLSIILVMLTQYIICDFLKNTNIVLIVITKTIIHAVSTIVLINLFQPIHNVEPNPDVIDLIKFYTNTNSSSTSSLESMADEKNAENIKSKNVGVQN